MLKSPELERKKTLESPPLSNNSKKVVELKEKIQKRAVRPLNVLENLEKRQTNPSKTVKGHPYLRNVRSSLNRTGNYPGFTLRCVLSAYLTWACPRCFATVKWRLLVYTDASPKKGTAVLVQISGSVGRVVFPFSHFLSR